ncbi:hypothetical protein IIZ77_03225 [Candidatus Saccharibacteria bacterium]|nr:hypothetical protein [Candidatus Saccharibacteria bacterium]
MSHFPADMDDPYDRPEYFDNDRRYADEYGEESVRRSEVLAEERRQSDEQF